MFVYVFFSFVHWCIFSFNLLLGLHKCIFHSLSIEIAVFSLLLLYLNLFLRKRSFHNFYMFQVFLLRFYPRFFTSLITYNLIFWVKMYFKIFLFKKMIEYVVRIQTIFLLFSWIYMKKLVEIFKLLSIHTYIHISFFLSLDN